MTSTYDTPQPVAAFPYRIRTTWIKEHSRGIAWEADLFYNDRKIGTVEQMGQGGADHVLISMPTDRNTWEADVALAFPGQTFEAATFYLLVKEEEGLA